MLFLGDFPEMVDKHLLAIPANGCFDQITDPEIGRIVRYHLLLRKDRRSAPYIKKGSGSRQSQQAS